MQSRLYVRVTLHLPASHSIPQTRVKTTPFQHMTQGMCSERSSVECETAPTKLQGHSLFFTLRLAVKSICLGHAHRCAISGRRFYGWRSSLSGTWIYHRTSFCRHSRSQHHPPILRLAGSSDTRKHLFSIIASPIFSGVIVFYRDYDFRGVQNMTRTPYLLSARCHADRADSGGPSRHNLRACELVLPRAEPAQMVA